MQQTNDIDRPALADSESSQARQWSMWIHLSGLCHYFVPIPGAGVILPLILWQVKKDESPYIDEQGKEAVNFQISILLYVVVSFVLCIVLIGIPLLISVLVFQLVASIIGGVRANDGHLIRYPMTIRWIS